MAKALLEYETLSGDEIRAVINGEEIIRPSEDDTPSDTGRRSSVPESGSTDQDKPTDLEPELQPEG